MKRYYKLALFAIFVLALAVRWWYLPAAAISFAYDQARDAFLVGEMLAGDLKILGPSVSGIPGLYHGVLYYYVIAPAYLLGQGSPVVVAYWLSFLSSLGVFIVFLFTRAITGKIWPALISALLFAFSFEASQYANLLTNASLGVLFVPLLYLGLYLWISKKTAWAPLLTGLGLGLSIQSEIALGYHLAPVVFWLLVYRKNIKRADFLKFLAALILATLSMILVEFKFGFKGISGLFYLFSSQDAIVQGRELGDILVIYLNQVGKTLAHTLFPLNIVFGGLAGIAIIFYSLLNVGRSENRAPAWQRFLATYILAHIAGLPFGGSNMKHIMVGAVAGISIFLGIFLWNYFRTRKLVLAGILVVVVAANLFKISRENINGQTIFPLQKDLVLSKELAAIDYTYQKAERDFSINTLTSPLFVNTLWSYLYNWYGKEKYGYLPSWQGKDQVGSLGNNLARSHPDVTTHFFIMEPTYGIPELYVGYARGEEDAKSSLVEEVSFGDIIVQERKNQ